MSVGDAMMPTMHRTIDKARRCSLNLKETINSYDLMASEYTARFLDAHLAVERQRFSTLLPKSSDPILDAGCGGGRDLAAFAAAGVPAVGVDLSSTLLDVARSRTPAPLIQGNLLQLPLSNETIRGVWACASLVHLELDGFKAAINEFSRVSIRSGIVFLSVRYGKGTEWRHDSLGGRRWFRFYTQQEVEGGLRDNGFDVLSCAVEPGVAAGTWVNALGRRR